MFEEIEWALQLPWNLIKERAFMWELDYKLVGSIVYVESEGDIFATRFEPKYRYLANPKKFAAINDITEETETHHQKTSWGLMQIMGGTARDLGYSGELPELLKPNLNLNYGCIYLKQKIEETPSLPYAIAAYNAGKAITNPVTKRLKNEKYVNKVAKYYRSIGGNL